ncbi:probable chitinase 10 isoform X2 [Diabrotica virgifera virgifera]|uniref:Probable chitinase 10 isoform X2 n=1 Tax=Diabrotica virgifera virgifera TaxID=50390 RepID=A0A6P7G780_DIAVI|nr:probable chitinase 10 isoform X2 [Diabrotica virgifera virgifera]
MVSVKMVLKWFCVLGLVTAANAYSTKDSKAINPKDINQWNIVQIVPTNSQSNNNSPPYAAPPGFVWIQAPASNFATSLGGSHSNSNSETKLPNYGSNNPITSPVTEGVSGSPPADTKPGTVTSSNAPTQVPDHPTVPTVVLPVTAPTVATLPPVLVDPDLQKRCLQPRGQFPSSSCKKYVNCWDGHVVEQECPEGLLFSTKGYCDYPYNVNCGDRGQYGGSKVVLPESSECPQESGTFREKHDCGSYYTCVFNKIVARYSCPVGLKFNEDLGICDYEANVDCSAKIINHSKTVIGVVTTEKNADHNEYIGQNTKCSVEYGTFRDMYRCNKYYICADFKIVSQHECPPGFNFNDNIGKCDYSHKVDCSKPQQIYEITKNSILQIPEEYREKVNNCKPGSVFRLNSECTAACLCRNGLAEVIQCPTGFAYDAAIDKCILRHLARC